MGIFKEPIVCRLEGSKHYQIEPWTTNNKTLRLLQPPLKRKSKEANNRRTPPLRLMALPQAPKQLPLMAKRRKKEMKKERKLKNFSKRTGNWKLIILTTWA